MPYRPALGSLLTCVLLLVLNACGTSRPASSPMASIEGHVVDSASGERLDSARIVHQTGDDTVSATAQGTFSIDGLAPGLYLFDVGKYGYHTQRHVSALIRPGDDEVELDVPLLPQELQINCGNLQVNYHDNVRDYIEQDSNAVRLRLVDLFAQNGEVRIQPVVLSNVSAPLFMPDNFGPQGHYDIELVDGNGNPVPYHHESGPVEAPDRNRIYRRGDILVVVPEQAKRLEPTILELEKDLPAGTPLYARMRYNFRLQDTLRSTPETDFPDEDLDSLQVPSYDTLRVDGSLLVPDSLVERRDTSVVRVVGVDTSVTRDGYLLYSTERDTNAFRNADEAVRELYVPDSVKARARLDSLIAQGVDTSRTAPDTADSVVRPSQPPTIRVVSRTEGRRLDSLVVDNDLARILRYGIPGPETSLDSLNLLTDSSLTAMLQPPRLERRPLRRYVPRPDSVLQDYPADSLGETLATLVRNEQIPSSLVRTSSPSDTLNRLRAGEDSLATDSTAAPAPPTDSLAAGEEPPPGAEGSVAPADTAGPVRRHLVSDTLTVGDLFPDASSDSLRARLERAGVAVDSVVVDSTLGAFVTDPPAGLLYTVPESQTATNGPVLVVDPVFERLRAQTALDTSTVDELLSLLPERLGKPPEPDIHRVVQQIILVPSGGYRQKYLNQWAAIQQTNLREHYCEVFRSSLQSPWRSTTTR